MNNPFVSPVPATSVDGPEYLAHRAAHLLQGAELASFTDASISHDSVREMIAHVTVNHAHLAKYVLALGQAMHSWDEPLVRDLETLEARLDAACLRRLVYVTSMILLLEEHVPPGFREFFWERVLKKVVVLRTLRRGASGPLPGESLSLWGLVEPLGLLVIGQQLGEPYFSLLDWAREHQLDILQAEHQALGFDHRAVSRAFIRLCGLLPSMPSPEHAGAFPTSDAEARQGTHDSQHFASLAERELLELMDPAPNLSWSATSSAIVTPEEVEEVRERMLRQLSELTAAFPPGSRPRNLGQRRDSPRPHSRLRPLRKTVGRQELMHQVAVAGTHCRGQRCPLSLVLWQADPPRDEALCHLALSPSWQDVQTIVNEIFPDRPPHFVLAEGLEALVLENCDRSEALRMARRLVDRLHQALRGEAGEAVHFNTFSAGVATMVMPPRNFVAEDLVKAATRCLDSAHLAGGGLVKSIDLL